MNLNRILVLSFLILVISTYQTDSGIILSLLLKVLLLKGALFMSMPLTIGSFMMGQGMGFFAGNMMGGYMMLRAANRYHNQEKGKWMGYGSEVAHHHTYKHPVVSSGGWGYDPSYKFQSAFDKGKDIGSAISSLTAHKLKLKSAVNHIKSALVAHKYPNKYPGWGWGGGYPGYSSSYKPTVAAYQYSKAPAYQKSKGWGWGSSDSAGGYKSEGHSGGHDHYHGSHSKPEPVTLKYKLLPYDKYKELTSGKGYDYGGSPPPVEQSYKSQAGAIYKGQMIYHDYFPPGSVSNDAKEPIVQDPANTYYTSAYGGPGHEYTGILTHNQRDSQAQDPAQDKSSEESGVFVDNVKRHPLSSESEISATLSPNPLLEKYLEKRLEEEAEKQKDVEQKEEAQQLIQMLRKAYLKQLVTSLKEEETLGSGSTEFTRDSRSIEKSDQKNLIRNLLLRNMQMSKKPSESKMEDRSSDSVNELMLESPPAPSTSSEMPVISSTERKIMSSSEKYTASSEKPISERVTTSTEKPVSSSENYVSETENYVSSSENYVSSTEAYVSSTEAYVSSTESPTTSSEKSQTAEPSPVLETPKRETRGEFADFGMEMPAMWVKADNTFSKEGSPFMIRVKRNAAEEPEGDEALYDETEPQAKGDTSTQPTMPVETEKQIHAFVDDIKKFFTLLTVLDQDQCLQKLVCDVHTNQKDLSTITQYEQNILTTFKLMKALMPPGEEDSSTKYRRAALIGETGQSLELCQQTFSPCGYSSSQIITLGTQTEATPTDWAGAGVPSPQAASRRSDYVSMMPRVRRTLRSFYV